MIIIDWFAAGVGIAGFAYTFYTVSGHIAWTFDHYPDVDNIVGGIIVGTFAAALWPVVLPCLLIHKHSREGIAALRYLVVERLMWRPQPRAEIVERRR